MISWQNAVMIFVIRCLYMGRPNSASVTASNVASQSPELLTPTSAAEAEQIIAEHFANFSNNPIADPSFDDLTLYTDVLNSTSPPPVAADVDDASQFFEVPTFPSAFDSPSPFTVNPQTLDTSCSVDPLMDSTVPPNSMPAPASNQPQQTESASGGPRATSSFYDSRFDLEEAALKSLYENMTELHPSGNFSKSNIFPGYIAGMVSRRKFDRDYTMQRLYELITRTSAVKLDWKPGWHMLDMWKKIDEFGREVLGIDPTAGPEDKRAAVEWNWYDILQYTGNDLPLV